MVEEKSHWKEKMRELESFEKRFPTLLRSAIRSIIASHILRAIVFILSVIQMANKRLVRINSTNSWINCSGWHRWNSLDEFINFVEIQIDTHSSHDFQNLWLIHSFLSWLMGINRWLPTNWKLDNRKRYRLTLALDAFVNAFYFRRVRLCIENRLLSFTRRSRVS